MVTLLTSFYIDTERQAEMTLCLLANLKNPYIDKVKVLCPKSVNLFNNPKLEKIDFEFRPKYSHFFDCFDKGVNIISNTDIFFDDTMNLCHNIGKKEVYALTVYDLGRDAKAIFRNRADSQDVWVFGSKPKQRCDYLVGVPGCDNRLAHDLATEFAVTNPSLTIKSYHLHNTGERTYTKVDTVPPPYKTVEPTTL